MMKLSKLFSLNSSLNFKLASISFGWIVSVFPKKGKKKDLLVKLNRIKKNKTNRFQVNGKGEKEEVDSIHLYHMSCVIYIELCVHIHAYMRAYINIYIGNRQLLKIPNTPICVGYILSKPAAAKKKTGHIILERERRKI
jgi:hypothetical protein